MIRITDRNTRIARRITRAYMTGRTVRRIVTERMGSWKWQAAFRVASYRLRRTRDGRLVWGAVDHSGKMSEPQLRRAGIFLPRGSLHNRQVRGSHFA